MPRGDLTGLNANFLNSIFPQNALWLMPNDLTVFQVREQLLDSDSGKGTALIAPGIYTFAQFERRLLSELPHPALADLDRLIYLNHLAADLWPTITTRPPQSRQVLELAKELGDGFDRLKLAGYKSAIPLAKLGAFGRAAGAYESLLKQSGQDDHFALRINLLTKLQDGMPFNALANIKNIVCRHSQRFSPFEVELIKALAQHYQVDITLDTPAWIRDETLGHGSGYEHLKAIRDLEKSQAPGLTLEFKTPDLSESAPFLTFASNYLLAPAESRPAPPPLGGCLAITRAPTRYHEAEEAGRRLKSLILSGTVPHRLAIVAPDLKIFGPLIEDVGRRYQIPLNFRRGVRLADQPPIKAIFEVLYLWESNWERSRVLRFLASPYFSLNGLDAEAVAKASLDLGVSDQRAGGGFEENLGKKRGEYSGLLNFIGRLKQMGRELNNSGGWPQFFIAFESTLALLKWPGDLKGPTAQADAAYAAAFKEALSGLKDAMETHGLAPSPSIAVFNLWLKNALDNEYINFDSYPADRVWALNYHETHGGQFDEIFFLGLNERVFPSLGAENQWWPDDLEPQIKPLVHSLWVSPAEKYRQDELLFTAGLGQAKNRVHLFYSGQDDSGRPSLPSPILSALMEIAPEAAIEATPWPIPPAAHQISSPDELWLWGAANHITPERMATIHAQHRDPKISPDLYAGLATRRRCFEETKTLPGAPADLWLGSLRKHNGLPLVKTADLADYAACPIGFFFKKALGLTAEGETIEEWPKTAEGEIAHRVLEKFFNRRLGNKFQGLTASPEEKAELQSLFEQEIAAHGLNAPVGRLPLWHERLKQLGQELQNWLTRAQWQFDDGFAPHALEWSFDQDGVGAPFPLTNQDGEIILYLKGRIDRIDLGPQSARVVDYKLKYRPDFKPTKNEPLPLPLYPMAVYMAAASLHFARPATGLLSFLNNSGQVYDLEINGDDQSFLSLNLEQRRSISANDGFNLFNHLTQIWQNISLGRFNLEEGGNTPACQWCGHGRLCPRRGV